MPALEAGDRRFKSSRSDRGEAAGRHHKKKSLIGSDSSCPSSPIGRGDWLRTSAVGVRIPRGVPVGNGPVVYGNGLISRHSRVRIPFPLPTPMGVYAVEGDANTAGTSQREQDQGRLATDLVSSH